MGLINRNLDKTILIDRQTKFPLQNDTQILAGELNPIECYKFTQSMVIDKDIIISDGSLVTFTSTCRNNVFIFYTGGGTLFSGNPNLLDVFDMILLGELGLAVPTTAKLFDLTVATGGRTTLFIRSCALGNWDTFGTLTGITTFAMDGQTDNVITDKGWKLNGIADVTMQTGRIGNFPSVAPGVIASEPFVQLTGGTFDRINMNGIITVPNATEEFLDIDPSVIMGRGVVGGNTYNKSEGGAFLAAGSIDETDVQWDFFNNGDAKDSATIGSMFFTNNTTATVIAKQGFDNAITAFADAGGGQVTGTSVAHGVANSEVIIIDDTTDYNGTYTASNVTADTFEITATFVATETGTLKIGFVDIAGTAEAAADNERFTFSTSPNELTSTNLKDKPLGVSLDVTATNGSSGVVFEFVTLKNGIIVNGSAAQGEFDNRVKGISKTRTTLAQTDDVYKSMVRNLETSANIIATSYSLTLK